MNISPNNNSIFGKSKTQALNAAKPSVDNSMQLPDTANKPAVTSPEANASVERGTPEGYKVPKQVGRGLRQAMAGEKPVIERQEGLKPNVLQEGYTNANGATSMPISTVSENGYAPTSYQTGTTVPAATDTMGSKLFESLQGQRSTQQEELANRLADQGYTGAQATSMMQRANRDFGLGMSQGLGEFNINRLQQAANINRDYLQLELQRELGLGNLQLGSDELDANIALALSQMAQNADTQTRREIADLMQTYFGSGTNV